MEQIKQSLRKVVTGPRNAIIQSLPNSEEAAVEAATILGTILDRNRLANGWNRLPDTEHDQQLISWLEVLDVNGVPFPAFDECYRAALKTRMRQKSAGVKLMPMAAEDLAVEWPAVKAAAEINHGPKRLAASSESDCPRCFGTGMEALPNNISRPGCSHAPLTDAERPLFIEARSKFNGMMAEGLLKIGVEIPTMPKPQPKKQKPSSVRLQCSHCARPANSLEGWMKHESCRALKKDQTVCVGVMRVSDAAIYVRM